MKDFRKTEIRNEKFKTAFSEIFTKGMNRDRRIEINGYTFIYGKFDNIGRVIEPNTGYALPVFSYCFDHFMWLI